MLAWPVLLPAWSSYHWLFHLIDDSAQFRPTAAFRHQGSCSAVRIHSSVNRTQTTVGNQWRSEALSGPGSTVTSFLRNFVEVSKFFIMVRWYPTNTSQQPSSCCHCHRHRCLWSLYYLVYIYSMFSSSI